MKKYVLFILLAICQIALAGDFEDAEKAYETKDYKTAFKTYQSAAQQGNAIAQYNLGLMYDNGQGVVQDYKEAVRWYRLAAVQGDASAQNNLGAKYGKGEGVVQNYMLAHMWASLAAANGDKLGAENRDIFARKMTTEQISKAQQMERDCQARNYKNCD